MNRQQSWQEYFQTGNKEPLIKAYWDSIQYIAWEKFPKEQEDMFQWGMIGFLKALRRLDRTRVKSLDAWVFLNVRSVMLNAYKRDNTEFILIDEVKHQIADKPEDLDTEIAINVCLQNLPTRERQILKKIYWDDLSRIEIGRQFGISSMRVGQLEQRALERLRYKGLNTGSSGVRAPL